LAKLSFFGPGIYFAYLLNKKGKVRRREGLKNRILLIHGGQAGGAGEQGRISTFKGGKRDEESTYFIALSRVHFRGGCRWLVATQGY
jgi:hypothetical protein